MRTERFDIGPGYVSVDLPVDREAPAEARRAVEHLADYVPPEPFEDLRLLVSEVVTNVVRHARFSPGAERLVRVRAVVTRDRAEASVCDSGEGFEPPADPRPNEDGSGGWGLFMLGKLSERWGIRREDGLFCVWFEIPR